MMRSYRFAAMAALVFTFLPAVATAADLGGPKNPPAPSHDEEYAVRYKGGAYIGLTGGYSAAVFEAETIDFGGQDPFVGAYGGYALVSNGWLLGLEGDWLLTAIETTNEGGGFAFKADSDYLASIRARGGITWGPVAFYVTGGVAFTEQTITVDGVEDSKHLVGAAFGGGIEAEVTRTLTVRLEALNYQFEAEDFQVGPDTVEAENSQTVVRAGVGFKLN